MTLDERVARLEERSERILESLNFIRERLDSMDERLDKLAANHAFLRGRVNMKMSASVSAVLIALWEAVKRILGL